MVSFSGAQFPQEVILHAVFFCVRYAGSYRDLEEILAERGVAVDYAILNQWVVKCALTRPWRLDETYVKVRGDWCYLYRAIERSGETLEFMLSVRRDEAAALQFLARTVSSNGLPRACAIEKSDVNTAGMAEMNNARRRVGSDRRIRGCRSNNLNNMVEQDHRGVQRRIRPMMCLHVNFCSRW